MTLFKSKFFKPNSRELVVPPSLADFVSLETEPHYLDGPLSTIVYDVLAPEENPYVKALQELIQVIIQPPSFGDRIDYQWVFLPKKIRLSSNLELRYVKYISLLEFYSTEYHTQKVTLQYKCYLPIRK